jgi:hypothetical protein
MVSDQMTAYELTCWTPRRWLFYLWALSHTREGDFPGTYRSDGPYWRSIADSTRLTWEWDTIKTMIGKDTSTYGDPDDPYDPLDRKMTSKNYQGFRVLGGVAHGLQAAGTHDMRLRYMEDSRSTLEFVPIGKSGINANASAQGGDDRLPSARNVIRLTAGGDYKDQSPDTAFDFHVHENYARMFEGQLVEGAAIHAEGQLLFDPTKDAAGGGVIVKAWTTDEETARDRILKGDPNQPGKGAKAPDDRYCWYPKTQGKYTGTYVYADGRADADGQRPLIYCGTADAVAFMRSQCPKVGICFAFVSENYKALLQGPFGEYNEDQFPIMFGERTILPQQLQYTLIDNVLGETAGNRLPVYYPVRVQVYARAGTVDWIKKAWQEAPFNTQVKVTPDGLIWLDALGEEQDSQPWCLWNGSITNYRMDPVTTMRPFRINAAVALDHRTIGASYIKDEPSSFDPAYILELGGVPYDYADAGESFREDYQYKSFPSPTLKWFGGEDGTEETVVGADGLTRYLPPNTEQAHATFAAQRRLAASRYPSRQSTWMMIGIRNDYQEGDWISKIEITNAADGERVYDINAPIEHITHDFTRQISIIGGLLSQLTMYGKGMSVFHRETPAQRAVARAFAAAPLGELPAAVGVDEPGGTAYV